MGGSCCRDDVEGHSEVVQVMSEKASPSAAKPLAATGLPDNCLDNKQGRTWRDEWVDLRMEELQLQGQGFLAKSDYFAQEGEGNLQNMTELFAKYVKWQVAAGWDRSQAEAYTVLASCGRAALGRAAREGANRYAASQSLVRSVLRAQSLKIKEPAPPSYRNLTGNFSLCNEDPCWEALVDRSKRHGSWSWFGCDTRSCDARSTEPGERDERADEEAMSLAERKLKWGEGLSFTTSAITTGVCDRAYFPDEKGFSVSICKGGKTRHVTQDSDIVCFQSAAADESGFHSLIQTAEGTYDLPPASTVELVSIQDPGDWKVYDKCIQRRLYTVSVTYK
eukprot:gnl/TRDRNA2_/TRDRNA2_195880_c0_seq1.p1 gnl/TRDRNA2_/TRDRNA2_195880_c0~~gnl/TRDRNA2_/TRDRNA2_195880_c0_seq1.p1  ORF type:complete len:335 (+),score=67.54 gnl/TRDRNA2_/TRDRNA2_195880_c0_seq1:131-1135(+)